MMFSYCVLFELSESNGNFIALNGCHIPLRVESKVVDVNSLQRFTVPRLAELWLEKSNINRLVKIFHGNLPSLEILDLQGCTGITDSGITTLNGILELSNLRRFLIRGCIDLFFLRIKIMNVLEIF